MLSRYACLLLQRSLNKQLCPKHHQPIVDMDELRLMADIML